MFSHLKGKEFVDLLEGIELPSSRRLHLERCVRCSACWRSLQAVHVEMTSLDDGIPEPDWSEFRASVRDRLLSRSVQRASAVRRWTGWPIRPAVAWALSLCVMAGITAGVFLWNAQPTDVPRTVIAEEPLSAPAIELNSADNELAAWSNVALFDEVNQLENSEQDELRVLLESAQKEIDK